MSSQPFSMPEAQPAPIYWTRSNHAASPIRFYFMAAFLLVLLLTGICAVIHGRLPNDQSILKFLQARDGCAAPCFMGIQPGVTLGDQAQEILRAHPWVQPQSIYVAEDTTRRYVWISWRWSAASPSFLTGSAYMTFSPQQDGHIRDIEMRTTLPYGAVWLALGMPDAGSLGLEHVARYSSRWLFTETSLGCGHFWERPTSFYMVAPVSLASASDLLHVQPYDSVLRARGCTGQKKR